MATKVEAMSISIRKCSVFFSVYRILAKINTGRLSFNVRNFSGFFVYGCMCTLYLCTGRSVKRILISTVVMKFLAFPIEPFTIKTYYDFKLRM